MQCPQCRAENRPDRRFCSACGAALPRACPACGFLNEPAARFCGGCGTAGLHPSTSSLGTPGQYTPPHLAERILNDRRALEGERKQVTVLFADLKGSLELLVDRDPEDARRLLDPVLERMMAAVHQYEGTVNQVMGDGIMALFGAPVAHEDHAVRAGYAALKMQESIAAYASQQVTRLPIDLHIRVGLNSGEVVVRAINNDLKMDYSAVGQTTHLASRMEQMASPGTILVTEAFARLAEGRLHFKPLGLMAVKGLVEPVDVLELVDAEPTRARFQAAAGRGLTRFVGRAPELTVIHRACARAAAGHGQAVA
ncbi:MAG TPA: adenylate/guanylate cyclase domain-containing protein, partial [Candidatus Dormibacteraeota bacterium]|nr:adenylate/guanylate cyclase domain-containing protein [Candidatus Dormibacteraeota bacterium]